MIKELLENYNNYKVSIKAKEHLITKMELEEINISGSNFEINGDIRPSGFMSSNIENKIVKRQDKIIRLKKEIEELNMKIDLIDSLINILPSYCQNVIISKFMKKNSIEEICDNTNKTKKTIHRIINKSIKIMEEIYAK